MFFFKQKTAYEMRISDWSSDVCSSDLQNALDLAAAIEAGCFHHASSIAAAGLYPGIFREDMFDEAEGLDDPYLRTKHDSEGLVREEKRIKWRIYRPGMVVGHSQTGEMDKRSEEHTSELQSLMRISYAVFCLKKKTKTIIDHTLQTTYKRI